MGLPRTMDGCMSRGGETGGASIKDALIEFERHGYAGQFRPKPDGMVECYGCNTVSPAEKVQRTALRRVEGASDPDDMVSINALVCPNCGEHGTAVMAYGPHASPEEAEVAQRLNAVHVATPGLDTGLLHPAEAEVPDMPSDADDDMLPPTPHSND